jgi:hypothetical protein
MIQATLRRTAAALAVATLLAVAAPAHAGGWRIAPVRSGWIENVLQWVARVWEVSGTERGLKAGMGIDPNGGPPPPDSTRQSIDPNG